MDVREKLFTLFQDCNNPSWKWFPNNAEMLKLIEYLVANGVTVQEQDGCEYCNGLPFSQMEDFTMPNASKKDYDIVTIRYCPICGRRLPQPPKGE